jgi:prolyl oligopeptidase
MLVPLQKPSAEEAIKAGQAFHYPPAPRGDHVDLYHGHRVADPYRWLEDPDSDASRAWIEAENRLTFEYLEQIPQRQSIQQRLTELWNYERYGVPTARGGRYFYSKNDGLQNQSVLYVADSLDGPSRVLLDPNQFSTDGTVALAGTVLSDDGKRLAYGVSEAGSDWRSWKIRDVATGHDLEDHLKWVKFSSVSWLKDASGLYYSRYDEPNEATKLVDQNFYQKLYLHRLGQPQSQDTLVYQRPDQKEWGFEPHVSEDGRYLIIQVWRGSEEKNGIFYLDLDQPGAKVVELLADFDAEYSFLGNVGPRFFFKTDAQAPRGRVVAIDLKHPDRASWEEIIPQADDALQSADYVGQRLIATYLKDAHSRISIFGLDGQHQREVDLPGLGTAMGFGGRSDQSETFYAFTSFTTPSAIYRYDVATGISTLFRKPEVDFQPSEYVTRQVFYQSSDGTRVPMFITHKKGIQLDGSNPTLLFGYGGFNIALTPRFSVSNLVWLEQGGIYVIANLRGGGEYGRTWHEAGMTPNKQNVFDDFIAAAQWLIDEKYTSPEKLAISGRSNGGLLVGACMVQRPELFGAAVPGVGVLDMLRFHKFTIGWAWVSEYGSSDDSQQFENLLTFSPLHNVRQGTAYPPTLIITADHDDRVVPAHSFKFAAELQHAQSGANPILIRIETKAGHGAGKPTTKLIEEATDVLSFLVRELKVSPTPRTH